jgi:hypothetical protein
MKKNDVNEKEYEKRVGHVKSLSSNAKVFKNWLLFKIDAD